MIGRTNVAGGGGLKSTDAILRVIAPAGSTVTISKGGVSKSDLGHENASDTSLYDYYFIIHASQFDSVNAWTVTATLGADTASDTIIIDSADEYDVQLYYKTYIYNRGEQVVALASTHNTNGIINFNADNIQITHVSGSTTGNAANVHTSNKFDVTDYDTLTFKMIVNHSSDGAPLKVGLASNTSYTPTFALSSTPSVQSNVEQEINLDVSNMSGSYYITCAGVSSSTYIYEIYLE